MINRRGAVVETDPFAQLDATAQADLVRRGEVRSIDLVEAAIARIERLNPILNAVVSTQFEEARRRASQGGLSGRFAGAPFLIKDLSAWGGAPLTYGSRFFGRMRARRDEGVVARALAAGFVPLGKTNTPEFGLLASTEPLLFGPTRNPWSLEHSPGGSSGGAAAAVAAGLTPIAHAGDGGGSIRIPASNCGVFGFKPSRDRCEPPFRKSPGDLSVQLCVSRSVRDSAGMLAVTELTDARARYPQLGFVSGPSTRRLRIGFTEASMIGTEPDRQVASALHDAARLCEELGHNVEPAAAPIAGEEAVAQFIGMWSETPTMVMRMLWALRLRAWQFGAITDCFEPWTLGLVEWNRHEEQRAPGVLARAIAFFEKVRQRFERFYDQYDLLLSPVLRCPPARLGEQAPSLPFETLLERSVDTVCYTPLHNAIGAPAMSAPLSMSDSGLPIGVQFAARPGRDRVLLELAYELEEARSWGDLWPPISSLSH